MKLFMERKKLLHSYISGYAEILSLLNRFDNESWDFIPSQGKWSIREIVIHLTDSEINGYTRCRNIIAESGKSIVNYDQDKWASSLNYNGQNMDMALDIFKLLRRANYDLLKDLPDEVWNNYMIHPDDGKVTLDDWLNNYENHVRIHLNQMQKNYDLWEKSL
jgi:hypothetical protein